MKSGDLIGHTHGDCEPVLTLHVDGVTPDFPPLEPPFTIFTPGILRCLLEDGFLSKSEDSASRVDGSAVDSPCAISPPSLVVRRSLPEIDLIP